MGRAPCCDKVGLNRGRWTAEEDDILTKYIQAKGEGSWRSLPKNAGLMRCGKSCRLRWVNYLKSDLKRGKFSSDEDETIIKLHSSLGNRWCLIASHLPGRTDNEIKNYWNSHLSRQIYKFRKIIQQLNQEQAVVDQPSKSAGSTDVAPKPPVSRKRKSITKKKTKVHDTPPEKVVDKSKELMTTSREVENGGSMELMPATPALEEADVMSSKMNLDIHEDKEPIDDIFLSSFLDDIVSDHGFDLAPIGDPNLQTLSQLHGSQNGELLLSNDEVEKWLMDDNNTVKSVGDPGLRSEAEKCGDQIYHFSSTNFYPNHELDVLGWDCGNMDWDGVQDQKLWDSEDGKFLSQLWEGTSDKDADGDKQNALVEWLLS